jgi:hypothetical protein
VFAIEARTALFKFLAKRYGRVPRSPQARFSALPFDLPRGFILPLEGRPDSGTLPTARQSPRTGGAVYPFTVTLEVTAEQAQGHQDELPPTPCQVADDPPRFDSLARETTVFQALRFATGARLFDFL